MVQSLYDKAFSRTNELAKDCFALIGDCLLVEYIEESEIKTSSGFYIPVTSKNLNDNWRAATSTDKPVFSRVLAVGNGYYSDDTNETIPLDVKAGDIILTGRQSIQWFSGFAELVDYKLHTIGLCRESEIRMRFNGQEGYDKFFEVLNSEYAKSLQDRNTK